MRWSIKLLRVKGIDIKVHLTFVLILVWAAYAWGTREGGGVPGALFGVAVTLLLFASVTLHELGHSLQALRLGVGVRGITLLPIGGVSEMEEIPDNPGQELRIAGIGPAISLAITAVLVAIGALLHAESVVTVAELLRSLGETNWAGLLAYLTMANLALALFNLIPAFPMDGGRVLRAVLAMRMDYQRATSVAVSVGQAWAWLLGLLGFLSGDFFLILIAFFVWLGAAQEGRLVEVKSVLRGLTVGRAMSRNFQSLSADDVLSRAADLTLGSFQADFPVMADGRIIGVLAADDLLEGLRSQGAGARVGQVMRTEFLTALVDEPLVQAQQRLGQAHATAMVVVERTGQVSGLLTVEDVNEAYRLLSVSPKAT